jgi:hypothetical protein
MIDLTLLYYFLTAVSIGAIALSLTGTTLYIRVICAKILLEIFEVSFNIIYLLI